MNKLKIAVLDNGADEKILALCGLPDIIQQNKGNISDEEDLFLHGTNCAMIIGLNNFALVAIPLFILAGGLMVQGGISRRIVDFADALIGHFPSGLALVSILACMFFAAITGSAIAATAAIGGIMIPIMREKNYEDTFSAPLIACGGSIGPIIPPSIPLLLYGTMAGVSVGKLFIGGFIPGIIMGLGLMIYSYYVGKKRHYVGREKRKEKRKVSCNYVTSRVQEKYSVSHQENRIYNHRLYEVTLSKYSEKMKKDSFVVNGKRYYWMSVTEMEKDENIMEKNREVVDFVKEKIV